MKWKILGLLLLGGAVVVTISALTQKNPSVAKEKSHKQRLLPIVDIPEKELTDPHLLSQRKEKASRYDRQSSQPIQEGYMISARVWSTHWFKDLTPLPFEHSDTVLIGGVIRSSAHLSNDKTGIYSEFDVQVEEVLKDTLNSINVGDKVCLERFGGAVRFPSGVIQKYETRGQGMPIVGERYVFFLKRKNEMDFAIVTGYQLDGQVVLPLDGAIMEEGQGAYPFDVHHGSDVSDFLRILRTQVSKQSNR